MEISFYVNNNFLSVKVIPGSGRTELKEENGKLKLYLKSPPDKNKANMELIKFFKKEYGLIVEIKSGLTGRNKMLRILR